MKGLTGGRVVLVDDDVTEATPVIKAFSKSGVPVAYFDGTQSELPRATGRLRGVRLAILDMDLGVGGSDENKASTLVAVLGSIIAKDNGPYGVLIWTKHPELKDLVTRYIYERSEVPNPVFVVMLHKSKFTKKTGGGGFAIGRLSKELIKELAENSPLECLQVWEGVCFQAATNVTNSLSEFPDSTSQNPAEWRKTWQDEAQRLLLAISKAKAEKNLSAENCMLSIFLALNPLHADRMDLLAGSIGDELTDHVTRILAATGGSKTERKAKVNSMLHLGSDQLDEFSPGNAYVFGKTNRPTFLPPLDDLLAGAVEADGAKGTANLAVLTANARPCGIEVTPLCDYAQGKMGFSKLIAGFVLAVEHEKSAKRTAGYLKRIGPMYLPKTRVIQPGPYNIYLDSRYMVAVKPSQVRALKPIARVRSQLLTDIQLWASYQAARQGVMLLA
jgi:hypothetical protein